MFLDTSGLLAVLFRDEPAHEPAVELFSQAVPKSVTGLVFAELVALAQARRYPRSPVLAFLDDLIAHPLVTVSWGEEALHRRATTLLADRPDKGYSLCDAMGFVVMRDAGKTDALTTDHHFEQEGFRRLLTP